MADGSCILSLEGHARHAPDEVVMQHAEGGCAATGARTLGWIKGTVRRGSSCVSVATDCVAARSGYHRAERPSIRGQQLIQLVRVCLHNTEVMMAVTMWLLGAW